MRKREFFQILTAGTVGIAGTAFLAGCMAPRVGKNVLDEQSGDPYRCERCGHHRRSLSALPGKADEANH